jgi:hypothetical protein
MLSGSKMLKHTAIFTYNCIALQSVHKTLDVNACGQCNCFFELKDKVQFHKVCEFSIHLFSAHITSNNTVHKICETIFPVYNIA